MESPVGALGAAGAAESVGALVTAEAGEASAGTKAHANARTAGT